MREGCAVMVEGSLYGIVISTKEKALFKGRIGKPKIAVCPDCGEISMYIENVEKLK